MERVIGITSIIMILGNAFIPVFTYASTGENIIIEGENIIIEGENIIIEGENVNSNINDNSENDEQEYQDNKNDQDNQNSQTNQDNQNSQTNQEDQNDLLENEISEKDSANEDEKGIEGNNLEEGKIDSDQNSGASISGNNDTNDGINQIQFIEETQNRLFNDNTVWNCPDNENICYNSENVAFRSGESIDLDGDPFSAGRIKVGGYIILDKNIGATSDDINSQDSFGKYYNNGSNTGYTLANAKVSRNRLGENPRDEEHNQGPCPDGYHIPDIDEWSNLREIRCLSKGLDEKCNDGDGFLSDLKLPKSGAKMRVGQGGYYWTSLKPGKTNRTSYASIEPDEIKFVDYSAGLETYPLSIRCMSNVSEKIEISFEESKGGQLINSIEIVKGLGINEYPFLGNSSSIIKGWYDDNDKRIIRNTPFYENKTLYPQRTDFEFSELELGGFKLLDRNLGATTNDISSGDSYGYYYYRGDNNGFPYNSVKQYEDGVGTWAGDENQQGPCPDGYHVPTSSEWNKIKNIWCLNKGYGIGCNNSEEFSNDLKLPISFYNETFNEKTEYGKFWSSTIFDNAKSYFMQEGKRYSNSSWSNVIQNSQDYNYNAKSIRCINNSIKYVLIRYESNGGTVVNPIKIIKGTNIGQFPTVEKEGFAFKGWFDGNGNEITQTMQINNDLVLYAKYTRMQNFIDQSGNEFQAGTFKIGDYTMLDRNIGATSNNITDPNSHGFYYYWGNNSGITSENYMDYSPVTTTWEGENNQQGPCPDGYHIPTSVEWYNIKEALCEAKGASQNCYISDSEMAIALKLPPAGFIGSSCYNHVCGKGQTLQYRTSTKNGESNAYAIYPTMGPSLNSSYQFSYGTPVRCIKRGDDSVTVTMDDGSDVKEIIIEKGVNIPNLGTESKDEYLLGGWYYESENGEKIELTNEDPIMDNLTISAEWENLEEYVVNHDKNSASLDDTNVTIGENVDINLKKSLTLGLEDVENVKYEGVSDNTSVVVTEGDVKSSDNNEATLHGGVSVYINKDEGDIVEKIGGTAKFSRPIIVKINLSEDMTGSVIVKVKHDGDDDFGFKGLTLKEKQNCVNGEPEEQPYNGEKIDIKVNNAKKYVTIYTCSASTFVAYTENNKPVENTTTSSTAAGGGRTITTKQETKITEQEHNSADTVDPEVTQTSNQTANTPAIKDQVKKIEGRELTRGEVAVMTNILLEVYPQLVEGKQELDDVTNACSNYADEQNFTKDEKKAITRLCKLSIMGIHNDTNEPLEEFLVNNKTTNDEFSKVINRSVSTYNEKDLSTIKDALKKLEGDEENVVFGTVYDMFMGIKNILS